MQRGMGHICENPFGVLRSSYLFMTFIFFIVLFSQQSFAETTNTYLQWECATGDDGKWICSQKSVLGNEYPRPNKIETFSVAEEEIENETVTQVKKANNLDWIDEEDLAEEQLASRASGCCGAYIEPERNYPDSNLEPEDAPLRVASESTELIQDNVAYLKGDVNITQGYRQARSDTATVDQINRTVDLEGDIELREPGILLRGDAAYMNMDSLDVEINNATYLLHESGARGTAQNLQRPGGDIFYIDDGGYTTCEPGNNAWRLVTSKLEVNPGTGIATGKHVRLEVKDIPVLYVPWVRFAIDDRRTSGLLFPSWENTEDNGLDFSQPIYLNLAPNYDATFTPRYIEERGEMAELEVRHLSKISETIFSGAFLSSDDGGGDDDDINSITKKKNQEGEDRWVADLRHNGSIRGWSSNLSYTRASDEDYFQDLDTTTLEVISKSYLEQKGAATKKIKNWDFLIEGSGYQTLIKDGLDQYKLLPRIQADGNFTVGNFEFSMNNQFSDYDHNEKSKVTGRRLKLDYSASWDSSWEWGYFRPILKIKHRTYDLDDPVYAGGDDSPSVTVPLGIIDTGIYLDRATTWLKGYTHTFEPRLYVVIASDEDQSDLPIFDTGEMTFDYDMLFRDEQFSGGDRISDTKQVSIGITTALIDDEDGIERISASLGQIHYFDDRNVSLGTSVTKEMKRDDSPYAAEFQMRLGDNWRAIADAQYDSDDSELDRGSFGLRYRGQGNRLLNLSYRFNNKDPLIINGKKYDNDIEQSDFSVAYPITRSWDFVARHNYDVTNTRILESFIGVQYESCCVRVSLLGRKFIDRDDLESLPMDKLEEDNGIFLSFQIKGIAGFGSKMDRIVQDGISGYEIPDN